MRPLPSRDAPRPPPIARSNSRLRDRGAWEGFELAVRAILGQQTAVSRTAARFLFHARRTSAIQLHAAPQYRGRINRLYNMMFKGALRSAPAVAGWLAHLTGLRVPSVAAALVLVLLMQWIVSQVKTVPTSKSMPVNSRDAPDLFFGALTK
jgi:hypothetical protein